MKRVLVDWGVTIENANPLVYVTSGAGKHCGKEIELNLPVNHQQARLLLNAAVVKCKGRRSIISSETKMELYSIPVIFIEVISFTRDDVRVWRMILPDEKGRYPNEAGCNPLFKGQIVIPSKLN